MNLRTRRLNLVSPRATSIISLGALSFQRFPRASFAGSNRKQEDEHKPEGHIYERDNSLPQWYGWHAFRRGLATNLHALGVDDKTIQAILRHSNVGLMMNVYVKSVNESQVSAMDSVSEKLGICNDRATDAPRRIQ